MPKMIHGARGLLGEIKKTITKKVTTFGSGDGCRRRAPEQDRGVWLHDESIDVLMTVVEGTFCEHP